MRAAVALLIVAHRWATSSAFQVLQRPVAFVHSQRAKAPFVNFEQQHKRFSLVPHLSTRGRLLVAFATSDGSTTTTSATGRGLETLFSQQADSDTGLISLSGFAKIDEINVLMEDGDLLEEEMNEVWQKYGSLDRAVGFDEFVKIYRDIDDLFEDDDDEEDEEDDGDDEKDATPTSDKAETPDDASLMGDDEAREELETIFKVISNKGLVSKGALRQWDEIETLIVDGMLGEEEFEELWEKEKSDELDFEGFMRFNSNLDELFDFDDEIDGQEEEEENETQAATAAEAAVEEEDEDEKQDEDEDLFELLADESGLVGMEELNSWDEVSEMLEDGDLLPEELDQIFKSSLAQSKDASKLDRQSFEALQDAIDDLFEDEEEEQPMEPEPAPVPAAPVSTSKPDLLRALALVNAPSNNMGVDDEEARLPCGLESTEREEKLVLNLANQLLQEDSNLLQQRQGNIETADVAGTWELSYTSSAAMKFNKGLSGIGGSFPNGRFGGLKQTLSASALLPDVEYKERIEVNPSSASFDVTVNGSWELRRSVSLFTGEKSIVLAVEPDRVMYGPTSTKADHWKSLGPTNMLDLVYLDEDLRIMRGSTSVDTILIFQRI